MQRAKNPGRWFTSTTMHHVKNLAVLMGRENVAILNKDDKALIALGLPPADKQNPILMNMEYLATLPDHTFVVASKYKLIPSIYASKENNDDGLTYSGPKQASIRFLKHHKADNPFLGGLGSFKPFLKRNNGDLKPI